jgi:hypothetical protein
MAVLAGQGAAEAHSGRANIDLRTVSAADLLLEPLISLLPDHLLCGLTFFPAVLG